MGHSYSRPNPDVKLKVIGCGMSRTGTASFSKALDILLGSPVYHGGTQLIYGGEEHMLGWINVFSHTPIKNEEDRTAVLEGLRQLVTGYSAVTDIPPCLFTEELMEAFPDAKIICTTRDPEKWWLSMKPMAESTDNKQGQNERIFGLILAFLPGLRHWNKLSEVMRHGRFGELFYQSGHQHPHPGQYQEHMDYLTRVVPKDRIHYFDIREGWEPLCKILECPIPDVPFPHINDSESAEKTIKSVLQKGLMAWTGVGLSVALILGVSIKFLRRR